jgi:hypothetical protein
MRLAAFALLLLAPPVWAQQQPIFPRFATAPRTCTAAARGFAYFNTTSGLPFVCDGSTWVDITVAGTVDTAALEAALPVSDATALVKGSGDPTKKVRLEADGCGAGTTCALTVTANTTAPIASQPITITGPSAARTWTGDDAAFTIATRDRPNAFTSTVSIEDGNFSLIGSGDPTKVVKVESDGLGTGVTATLNVAGTTTLPIYGQAITYTGPTTARTVTYPDQDFAVAGLGVDQTFTGVTVANGVWTFGGNQGDANTISFNATTNRIVFEGAVADANEMTLWFDEANADRNWFFPNLVATTITALSQNVAQSVSAAHVFVNAIFYFGSVEAVTTTKTTSSQEGNETYTNTGDTDGATITLLNDPTAGATWNFAVNVAQTLTIVPSAGETLYLGADQCVVSITSNTIGSTLTIRAVVGGSGGRFMSFGQTGTWVCNDV